MTRKLLLTSILILSSIVAVNAQQRVQVMDMGGVPIPFVTVTTPEGKFVGLTDIDGWLDVASGNTTITLSQVAYKPLTVEVASIKEGKITLEEETYDLPEVVVKPKELIYGRTYFRLTYTDDDGPVYYRAGVIDNTYDRTKKKVDAKTSHISKAEIGLIRFLIDRLSGKFDRFSRLPQVSYYQKILQMRDEGEITLTDAGNGRQVIADDVSPLGYIDWNAEDCTRTVSFDMFRYLKHIKDAKKRAKAEKKGKAYEADSTLIIDGTIYQVYRTDSVGNSRVDDFVMSQYTQKGLHRHQGTNYVIQVQSFATDYAYIDKKEYKQLRKDNKVEMNINELRQFEKNNKIPPLAPNIREQIDKLFVKELGQ